MVPACTTSALRAFGVLPEQGEPAPDSICSADERSVVMLLGGEPVGPRRIWWNFVSSRQERIEQAKADWRAGRIKLPLNEDQEFIPLPEEPPKPKPEPMS